MLETKGFQHVGYVTMNSNYTEGPNTWVDKIHFFKFIFRRLYISLYLLAFHFMLRSLLVSNQQLTQ